MYINQIKYLENQLTCLKQMKSNADNVGDKELSKRVQVNINEFLQAIENLKRGVK